MANAAARVPMATTPWGNDTIMRSPLGLTAKTFYPGMMTALNSSGYAVSCDDTAGIRFDGILSDSVRLTLTGNETQAEIAADQTKQVLVERPWRFTMAIASAVAGDEGKALYAVDDNHVGYTSVSSILVGWVDQVLSSTLVLVNPLYGPLTNLSVASNTLTFAGSTGQNNVAIPDNLADALHVSQGANVYLKFTTTDGSEVSLLRGPDATGATNAGGSAQVVGGIGGATSGAGGAVSLTGGAGTLNAAGGTATQTGGAGQGTGAGGAAGMTGGASGAGATGNGGAASVTGGAAASTNGTGGAASLVGGLGTGTGAGGAVTITSGAAGATGVAGAVNISVGSATAGNGSALTLTGGSGAGGTASGGNVNLIPGAAVSTGTPGELQVNSAAGVWEVNWQQFLAANVPVSGTSYPVYLATRAMRVKAVKVVCSSTGTVPTVDVIKDTGTTAPGGGTSVLTGVVTFSGTANTVVSGTLTSTVATVTMAAGDRLSLKWAGTVGSITGAVVNVLLVPC